MERMWTPESDGYGAEQSISKIWNSALFSPI
jgi:hypothetical protein